MDYNLRNLISSIEGLDASDPRFPSNVRKVRRTKKEQPDEWKVRLLSRLREQLDKEEKEEVSVISTMEASMATMLEKEVGDLSPYISVTEYPPLFLLKERRLDTTASETGQLGVALTSVAEWVCDTYNSKSAEATTCDLRCDQCNAVKLLNCYFQNATAISSDKE